MTLEETGTNKVSRIFSCKHRLNLMLSLCQTEVTWIFSEEEIGKLKSHEEAGTNCELVGREDSLLYQIAET